MKPRHLLMLAAFTLAAALLAFGDSKPETAVAQPIRRAPGPIASPDAVRPAAETREPATGGSRPSPSGADADRQILALVPRHELIADRRGNEDDDRLFSTMSWAPPPPPVAVKEVVPPTPPTAPALPYTYLGRQLSGGQLEVYLGRGDRVFVARNLTVIEGTYRVESIDPPTLSLTYLPLNQVQKLSIGVTD